MTEFENYAENGEFFVEFNNFYLGCGSSVWQLAVNSRDIRRDMLLPTVERTCQNLCWQIFVALPGGSQLFDCLSGAENSDIGSGEFAGKIFTDGGMLKLFPADPVQRGFCFLRCYLEKITRRSGKDGSSSTVELEFSCRKTSDTNQYLTRMDAGARPQGALYRRQPDAARASRLLLEFLGKKLNKTPGMDLNLNFFAPSDEQGAMLKLNACKAWRYNAPRILEYTLICRSRVEDKIDADQKLYSAVVELNDCRIKLDESFQAWVVVKSLEFDGVKSINGMISLESICRLDLICI